MEATLVMSGLHVSLRSAVDLSEHDCNESISSVRSPGSVSSERVRSIAGRSWLLVGHANVVPGLWVEVWRRLLLRLAMPMSSSRYPKHVIPELTSQRQKRQRYQSQTAYMSAEGVLVRKVAVRIYHADVFMSEGMTSSAWWLAIAR